MIDPQATTTFQQVALNAIKVAIRQEVSRELIYVARSAEVVAEELAHRIAFELRAHVLAEQLPPQQIHHLVRIETHDPRHATWWDHWKATYQQRWWMRWRRWTIRYTDTPVAVQRLVTVDVRNHWTFPRASIIPPDAHLGQPVMVSIWNAQDRPW